jgi:hypothetical protein
MFINFKDGKKAKPNRNEKNVIYIRLCQKVILEIKKKSK